MSTEDKIRTLAKERGVDPVPLLIRDLAEEYSVDPTPLLEAPELARKEAAYWDNQRALIASAAPAEAKQQQEKARKAIDAMALRAKAAFHWNLFHILGDKMRLDDAAMHRLAETDLVGCVSEALVGTTEDDLADKETWDKPRLYRRLARAWKQAYTEEHGEVDEELKLWYTQGLHTFVRFALEGVENKERTPDAVRILLKRHTPHL